MAKFVPVKPLDFRILDNIQELKLADILRFGEGNTVLVNDLPLGKKLVYYGFLLNPDREIIDVKWPTKNELRIISRLERQTSIQEIPDMVVFDLERKDGGRIPLVFNSQGKQSLARYNSDGSTAVNYFGLVPSEEIQTVTGVKRKLGMGGTRKRNYRKKSTRKRRTI